MSLAWTGLLPGHTADAIFEIDTAQDFTQFRDAAKDFAVPSQNLLYADTKGHIGYQAPGQVPIRASSTTGAPAGYWPAPGWDPKYDWKGFVPFEQMPTAYDPPEGYIVAANQAVTASQTPFLTTEWDYGYRSERIRTLITATPKVTPARMSQIQGDTHNDFRARAGQGAAGGQARPTTRSPKKLRTSCATGTTPSRAAGRRRRPPPPTTTRCGATSCS